ncbi:MAG: hypothetical protein HC884_10395 [Chloroflexaceae bacterium]|nr:hypothetical protein [Chloroflexaceae bacterium]
MVEMKQIAGDLLVRTPEQMQQRLAWNDWFLLEVTEKGRVLYASSHERMGQWSHGARSDTT